MILHTCPDCGTPGFYASDLQGEVNCRSCGKAFELSRFTKTEKDSLVKFVESMRASAEGVRRSRALVYCFTGILLLVIVWAGVSTLGVIPDEWRILNRRFTGLDNQDAIEQSIGLVAIGEVGEGGAIAFASFGTAFAVANDGYMLTSKHVVDHVPSGSSIWVYINKRRLDARLVAQEMVDDWAILKVEEDLPYRFRLAARGTIGRLNVEVTALGFQETLADVPSTVTDTPLARTTGSISRIYNDKVGTEWIEHTAALNPGSSGGPLLVDDIVVGLNTGGKPGVYRALSVGAFRKKLWRMIDRSRKEDRSISVRVDQGRGIP